MNANKRPLQRSLIITCSVFVGLLCVVLSLQTYLLFSSWYYEQSDKNLEHVLHAVSRSLDADELQESVRTGKAPAEQAELQQFFNDALVDFDLAYLYLSIPHEDGTMVSLVAATTPEEQAAGETDWPFLFADTEGYTDKTIAPYLNCWDAEGITYFTSDSAWGKCYTACMPLRDSAGKMVALLCADMYTHDMFSEINVSVLSCIVLTLGAGVLFVAMLVMWLRHDVTEPIHLLEESTRAFARKSHGRRDPDALRFEPPDIHTQNEVESLSEAITQMSMDMRDYVQHILTAEALMRSAQAKAEGMSKIAFEDGLTRAKSKAAYVRAVERIVLAIEGEQEEPDFAVLMIDLNNLKYVNDTYGHERGDAYLVGSCRLIRNVLGDVPLYRTGGDEFVAILEDKDYERREDLLARLRSTFATTQANEAAEPWERYSAACGMAEHRKEESYKGTFSRADKSMYENKVQMKRDMGKYVKAR